MLDAKLHINSTISDASRGARYMGIDIKNYYLGTPMKYYQYIRILAKMIPKKSGTTPATRHTLKPTVSSTLKFVAACTDSKKPAF
jgi:hypothetical protein